MSFKMDRVHIWSCEVRDEVGGVAKTLSALAEAGSNLDYVYTQRNPGKPGEGTLYVSPLTTPEQIRLARSIGMAESFDPVVMRLEGDNTAGLAHRLKIEWAKAGINLHGSILGVLGGRFLGYVTFDSIDDANRAARILAEIGIQRQ